jgi:hypothetical protein
VELVKRMEKSPHFRMPQVEAESALGEGNAGPVGGNIQFEIASVYIPFVDDTDATTDDDQPAKKPAEKTAGGSNGGSNSAKVASAKPGGAR